MLNKNKSSQLPVETVPLLSQPSDDFFLKYVLPHVTFLHDHSRDDFFIVKLLSNAFNYFLQAVNSIGNSFIFKAVGENKAAALTSSFQSCARNVISGMLGALMQMLGEALGEMEANKDNPEALKKAAKKVYRLIIVSYLLTGVFTAASSALYLIAYFVFPLAYPADTANPTRDYIFYTGLSNWFTLGLTMLTQIPFAFHYWKSPVLTALMSRIPALIYSYFLAISFDLKASGLGIGNALGPTFVYCLTELWIRRQSEFSFLFTDPDILEKRARAVMNNTVYDEPSGIKAWREWINTEVVIAKQEYFWEAFCFCLLVGLQRSTEWVNVLAITLFIGFLSTSNLEAMNAALNMISLLGLFSQGVGSGGATRLGQLRKEMNTLLKKENISEADYTRIHSIFNEIKYKSKMSLLLGAGINCAFASLMCFFETFIVNQFLDDNSPPDLRSTSRILFWLTMIALSFDSPRIVATSLLGAYRKMKAPNAVSLTLMTGVGILVPLIYQLATKKNDNTVAILTFSLRALMVFLSGASNIFTLYQCIMDDKKEIDRLQRPHIAVVVTRPRKSDMSVNGDSPKASRKSSSLMGGFVRSISDLTRKQQTPRVTEASSLVANF